MDWRDIVNGGLEIFGALFLLLHVRQAMRSRSVSGASVWPVMYFTGWGTWNVVFYYPSLAQPLSWAGALLCVFAQVAYLSMFWRYRCRS